MNLKSTVTFVVSYVMYVKKNKNKPKQNEDAK